MKLKSLRATTVTLVAGVAFTALAACGSDDNVAEPAMTANAPASSTGEQQVIESSSPGTATPPPSNDTRAAAVDEQLTDGEYSTGPTEEFGGSYGELRTTDIRVGSHDNYDRLVFEFAGHGEPQYHAGYNDDPRQQASGFPLEVPGNAKLELMIHGTAGDMSADAKYAATKELGLASGNIVEVYNGGTFEADSQYIVGIDTKRPYKVSVLHEPTRLVVDFQK